MGLPFVGNLRGGFVFFFFFFWYTYTKFFYNGVPRPFIKIRIALWPNVGPDFNNEWVIYDEIKLKWSSRVQLLRPTGGEKWMSGEKELIKFSAADTTDILSIEYSTDDGSTYSLIADSIKASDGQYEWTIPDVEPTNKAKVRITSIITGDSAKSNNFLMKPYIITRLDNNGDLIAYDINTDRWGFGNTGAEMWPDTFYNHIDYKTGIDPHTNNVYDQTAAGGVFATADSTDFPAWVSFTDAFGINACFTGAGEYIPTALLKWKSFIGNWGGSCFGIAAANALAFENKNQFQSHFSFLTNFANPISLTSDWSVIYVTSELFTHQFGNPSIQNDVSGNGIKTPSQTIDDLKEMLKQETTQLRTITMIKSTGGGHTILPYKLEQDTLNTNMYYVYVYDNSYPNVTDARIVVDVDHNGGIGLWDPDYAWNGWGGESGFYLEIPSQLYFNNAIFPKSVVANNSPFMMAEDELMVSLPSQASIKIEDELGNKTGYLNGQVLNEIPGSKPLMLKNGSESPPYGYHLPTDNYSVIMDNFTADTMDAYFFTGNKSFEYERYGATQTQTDRLFFDGGVSVTNPEAEAKSVKLLNIISDTTSADEKLFSFRSLNLAQNDSVKIINPDNNSLDLISYGSQKNYQIELEYVSDVISSRFLNDNVSLSANTTHKLVPNWGDFADLFLTIYVDEGNNGTIDDTLEIINQVTEVGEDQGLLIPAEYRLEQNYPNPFNNSTVIKYSVAKEGVVTLKIYNAIGEEVATLINETKQPGNYEVTFSTEQLTSGVYFYSLQAVDFVQTKKMVLMK